MHYETCRSHQMQKHKFIVTCPNALFVKSVLVPPEHEKYCIDLLGPRRTRMHYVTHRSHWMQKHKFGVTCPDALFIKSISVPPDMKNSALTFDTSDAPECTM
jgi:hypothetical protein